MDTEVLKKEKRQELQRKVDQINELTNQKRALLDEALRIEGELRILNTLSDKGGKEVETDKEGDKQLSPKGVA